MTLNKILTRSTFAGCALIALGVAPALSADVLYQEPPMVTDPGPVQFGAPIAGWDGPYAGISLGYGFHGRTNEEGGNTIDTDGWMGGVFGGYNFQQGLMVYGLEGDVNFRGPRGSEGNVESRTSFDGSIRGRVGAAVTDDILLYGTAGGAAERQRITVGNTSDSNTMLGYTVGAGVDARLMDDVFGRVEYRFTDYGSKDFNFGGGDRRFDTSNHRVTVGLGVKF